MRSNQLIFGLAIGLITFTFGCVPKEPVTQVRPAVEVTEPNDLTEPAPSDQLSTLDDPSDLPNTAKPLEENEMSAMLEGVQALAEQAGKHWRNGDVEKALADLDQAYANLLLIEETENMDILQEKENLRLLISKRIVEVYSSRRVTTGRMDQAIPIIRNEHVEAEIRSLLGPERKFFIAAYARSGMYRPMILEMLRKEGLPEQLSWLPLIESGFKNNALSTARALGMWQFIPSTGFRYGLTRDNWIDERMDPEKSTIAAIKYLHELHEMFGDWMAALAGYNCGEARVMRAIKSQQINYMDDFWDLYGKLPRETARYVPRFFATLIILEDPAKFGLELPPLAQPIPYTTTEVKRAVKLADLNQQLNLPPDTLRILNPELRHKATPGYAYALKVPKGSHEQVAAQINSLPPLEMIPELEDDPGDPLRHRVRRGETLSIIAAKYKTTVSKLAKLNNLKTKTRIKQGQLLRIPGNKAPYPNKRTTAEVKKQKPVTAISTSVHTVKHGESLWSIARDYGITTEQLRAMNQIHNSYLTSGQKLKIPTPKNLDEGESKRTYQVKKGDTLAKIAQKHKVGLDRLLQANNMKSNDPIYPKQTLVVPD